MTPRSLRTSTRNKLQLPIMIMMSIFVKGREVLSIPFASDVWIIYSSISTRLLSWSYRQSGTSDAVSEICDGAQIKIHDHAQSSKITHPPLTDSHPEGTGQAKVWRRPINTACVWYHDAFSLFIYLRKPHAQTLISHC